MGRTRSETKPGGTLLSEDDVVFTRRLASDVEGWLSDAEGRALYGLAASIDRTLAIVEIGSWKGKSTVWLARGARAGGRATVFAVDAHTGTADPRERVRQGSAGGEIWSFDAFCGSIAAAGVAESVEAIVARSEEAARSFSRPVGLLFIDGDHSYDGVRRDLELWCPKLVPNGIVAFHDTNVDAYPGVKRLVKEAVFRSGTFARIRHVDSMLYAQKVTRRSWVDELGALSALVLRYPDDYVTVLRWHWFPRWFRRRVRLLLQRLQRRPPRNPGAPAC